MQLEELHFMLDDKRDEIVRFERDGALLFKADDMETLFDTNFKQNDIAVCKSGHRYIASVERYQMLYGPYKWMQIIDWSRVE